MDRSRREACAACRARKVRCNGEQSCQQCAHLGLTCSYSTVSSSSRSRKSIVRGRVIEMIKTSEFPPVHDKPAAVQLQFPQVPNEQLKSPTSITFDAAFFTGLAARYGRVIFPVYPIITEAEFRSAIERLYCCQDDCALVNGLGALTMNMALTGPKYPFNEFDQIASMYTKAIELSGPVMPNGRVTVQSTMISLIASICLFATHCDINMALYYVREAVAKVQALGVNNPLELNFLDEREQAQRERLYWLLFVHERSVAVTYYQPVILSPLPNLPRIDTLIDTGVHAWFTEIIRLFKVIDSTFISNWLDREDPSMTFAWIQTKQAELGEREDRWEDEIRGMSDMQQVDLIVTRYWLHTLVWQMALSKHLLVLDVDGERGPMSIFFPMQLSHRIRVLLLTKPREAVDVHGMCILQKIFEITATIADILVYISAAIESDERKLAHLDNFMFLHQFLLSMSKSYHVDKAILQDKFETLQTLFPSLGGTATALQATA